MAPQGALDRMAFPSKPRSGASVFPAFGMRLKAPLILP